MGLYGSCLTGQSRYNVDGSNKPVRITKMASLGSFGKIIQKSEREVGRETVYDTLEWFGEEIRLREWISPLPMMKLAEVMDSGRSQLIVPVVASVRAVIEASILEDDWPSFESLALQNDAEVDLLNEVAEHLFIMWCRRPTQRVSDSSTGHSEPTTEELSSEPSSVVSMDLPPQVSSNPETSEPVLATTS
jgi:hypothetical protein